MWVPGSEEFACLLRVLWISHRIQDSRHKKETRRESYILHRHLSFIFCLYWVSVYGVHVRSLFLAVFFKTLYFASTRKCTLVVHFLSLLSVYDVHVRGLFLSVFFENCILHRRACTRLPFILCLYWVFMACMCAAYLFVAVFFEFIFFLHWRFPGVHVRGLFWVNF